MVECISRFIGLTLLFIIVFFIIRGYIKVAVDSKLSRNKRKQFKQNQNIVEWFTYLRYHDAIPKPLFVWYYSNIIIYFIFSVLTIICEVNVVVVYMVFSALPMIVAQIWLSKIDK